MKPALVTLLLLSLALTGCIVESGGGYGSRGYGDRGGEHQDRGEHDRGDRDRAGTHNDQGPLGNWGR